MSPPFVKMTAMSLPTDFDLTTWCQENRAVGARIVNGRIVAVIPMLFDKWRLTIGDEWTVDHGY
jgi:hypothetical protein